MNISTPALPPARAVAIPSHLSGAVILVQDANVGRHDAFGARVIPIRFLLVELLDFLPGLGFPAHGLGRAVDGFVVAGLPGGLDVRHFERLDGVLLLALVARVRRRCICLE